MRSRIALLLAALSALPLFAQPLVIRTLAGPHGGGGFADAFGVSARFSVPRAIAADAAGNLWVADTGNHVIRRVSPDGGVTTVAGAAGVAGFADGAGAAARFRFPAGIAVDPTNGMIWISDKDNHVIRRMTPDGTVTTIAGQPGVPGSADGVGGDAKFGFPRGLAVDSTGIVYVADTQNHVIRRVTAAGFANTFAGKMLVQGDADGAALDARFRAPSDVAVDGLDRVFVSDTGNHRIRRIADGVVTTVAGSTEGFRDGQGTRAQFNSPWGLDSDSSGNLYVADHDNQRLRAVTTSGLVTTFIADVFEAPSGVALANGVVYVSDAVNHAIHRVDPATGQATTLAGSVPTPGLFELPYAVASDVAGNTYVANGDSVERIAPDGNVTTFATGFDLVSGIAIGPDQNLYVVDVAAARVYRVTQGGTITTIARSEDGLESPWGIALDSDGDIYITDLSAHVVHFLGTSRMVTTFAGTGNPGLFDGPAESARFRSPSGIAIDAADNVYITDFGNNAVRKYTRATGQISTLVPPAAGLNAPSGIAALADGTIYVADYNHAIYRVTPAGAMELVAGLPGTPGNVDGTGKRARFSYPEGLALTTDGELLIADSYNHAVRIGRVLAGANRQRVVRR